jgi:hypothetical protein
VYEVKSVMVKLPLYKLKFFYKILTTFSSESSPADVSLPFIQVLLSSAEQCFEIQLEATALSQFTLPLVIEVKLWAC